MKESNYAALGMTANQAQGLAERSRMIPKTLGIVLNAVTHSYKVMECL